DLTYVCRWSWRRDLNPRPADYKSAALPTELRQPEQKANFSTSCATRASNWTHFLRLSLLRWSQLAIVLGLAACQISLPDRFEQGDSGRNRHIETVDMATHRYGNQPVAMIADEPPQADAFGPDDERGRQRQVDLVVSFGAIPCQTDGPDARLLQRLEGARDVHHLRHLHVRDGAG